MRDAPCPSTVTDDDGASSGSDDANSGRTKIECNLRPTRIVLSELKLFVGEVVMNARL